MFRQYLSSGMTTTRWGVMRGFSSGVLIVYFFLQTRAGRLEEVQASASSGVVADVALLLIWTTKIVRGCSHGREEEKNKNLVLVTFSVAGIVTVVRRFPRNGELEFGQPCGDFVKEA
jgi:hypothetical protein